MSPIRAVLSGAVIAIIVAGCVDRESPTSPRLPRIAAVLWPNEPTDAALVTDQPWESATFDGWHLEENDSGYVSIAQDASAPFSPSGVLQARLPAGFTGGELAYPNRDINPTPRVYVGLWWKPSNPWSGPGMPIQYLLTSVDGLISMSMVDSAESGRYKLKVHPGFTTSPDNQLLEQNVNPNVSITLGQWHRVEWLVDYSTASGRVEWWLDGVLLGNYNNDAAPPGGLQFIQYNHYMEWHGPAKPQADYFWFDHTRVSTFAAGSGSSWPLLTNTFPQLDITRLVRLPSGRWLYRANVTLRFKDDVSDAAKNGFFNRHDMSVVGVTRSGRFFVGMPDPGPVLDSLFSRLERLNGEPEILAAASLDFSPPEQAADFRFPTDGPGQARSDWTGSSSSTWALRAIRAPLAWGCETGTYGGAVPAVGIFEWKHQPSHPEFASSSPRFWEPPDAPLAHIPSAAPALVDSMERHAAATTGLLAAEGNNASGIAGVNWRTGLYLYAGYSSPGNHALPIIDNFFVLAERIVQDQLRVLSLSADAAVDSTRPVADRVRDIGLLSGDIQHDLLDRAPSLLVVVAAGNDRYRGTDTAYVRENRAQVLRAALLLVRNNPAYRDRIIVVAGTIPNNGLWDRGAANPNQGSNVFSNATDIAAPAQDVTVLARWTGQTGSAVPLRLATGTSLAAPLVAGTAGLLLAMDPTLSAAQLKDYIVRGAQQPRWNLTTQQLEIPQPLGGTPETIYQLDAYSALTLFAAERQQEPLCGNRVWVANNAVIAERDPVAHTTETLVNLGEAGAGVNVYHGGRRIEVATALGDRDRFFELRQRKWVETPDTATTPVGGTFSSMWALSHDWDSTATFRYWTTPGSASFEINIFDFRTQTGTTIDTLVLATSQFSGSVCVQLDNHGACVSSSPTGNEESVVAELVFPSIGGKLLIAVTYFVTRDVGLGGWQTCPRADSMAVSCRSISYQQRTERAELWAVDLRNGQETHLWTFPDRVFWFGASEDGAQLVSGEGVGTVAWSWLQGEQTWSDGGTVTGCAVHYHPTTGPMELVPAIATADACAIAKRGQGSIAPAPPRASSP